MANIDDFNHDFNKTLMRQVAKLQDQIARDIMAGASFSTAANAGTSAAPGTEATLTYEGMQDMIHALYEVKIKMPAPRLQLFESVHAVKRDGDRPQQFKRSWKERLWSWPWTPWVKEKTIMVPNYKPAIYRVGNQVIYHPALRERLMISINEGSVKDGWDKR